MQCDTAIVGSGPGGAVAASLLAGAGHDVLILEEGPDAIRAPVAPYSSEEMEEKYRNRGVTVAFGNPSVTYAEGRCVGGGSEVNAGLIYRTPDAVLEEWTESFRVQNLLPDDLAPHYESIEKELGVAKAATPSLQGQRMRDGAARLGFRSLDSPTSFHDGNRVSQDGEARRASMSRTYLAWALDDGARLAPDTRVLRLRREAGRWRLLAIHGRGADRRAVEIVARQVFVACGAVHTPALLRRSGIRRNVGNSLAMQPTLKVTARFPDVVNDGSMGVPTSAVDHFAPRFFFTCAASGPSHLAMEMLQYEGDFHRLRDEWQHMAIYSARTSGGRGWVRNVPGFSDPLVLYRLSPKDLQDLAEATQRLCELLFAAGADALYPSTSLGAPIERVEDVPRRLATLQRGRTNLMTIHLSSSCPMGESEACAVDSDGRVHGVDDLYVADASLLPTAPTVNPQGSIMAVARRNLLSLLGGS